MSVPHVHACARVACTILRFCTLPSFFVPLYQNATLSNRFIDTIRLHVCGGSGGMGLPKYKGVGGNGGNVYLKAAKGSSLKTVLQKYSKKTVTAGSGKNSKKFCIFGESGEDKIVNVPLGVTVYDKYFRILGELNEAGQELLVAEGGPGGSANSNPPYSGSAGFSQVITVDLKIIADVGLVGFPNAGKSTVLKAVSRAKPKIAAYSFTTLQPNIGVIEYPDLRQIRMADLPGLIEGASYNIGLGHKFLKHVERSNLLLMVVDIDGFKLSPMSKFRSCVETVFILNKELELYNKDLLNKPAILAINKMDLPGALSTFTEITPILKDLPGYASRLPEEIRPEKFLNFDTIIPISAKCDRDSVQQLKEEVRKSLDEHFTSSMEEIMTKKEMELLRKIKQQSAEIVNVVL